MNRRPPDVSSSCATSATGVADGCRRRCRKNQNVAADLSGLLEDKFDIPEFLEEQSGYISTLKTWLAYIRDYDKLMFGCRLVLANYEDYIEITKQLIPEKC